MATTKKHTAVYLAPEVEQALIAFCEQKGLKSKKGVVLSAGINTVLAEFFGISDTEKGSTPIEPGNIPSRVSSIPSKPTSNIPVESSSIPNKSSSIPTTNIGSTPIQTTSNIPLKTLVVEVLPGMSQA